MRVAVVGGTGAAGRHAAEALRRTGHDPVMIARSQGVDVFTGRGLDDALAGVDVVVDASSDMVRRIAIARNESLTLIPSWRTGIFGVDAAGEMLLPDAGAQRAPTTFDVWLAALSARSDRVGDR